VFVQLSQSDINCDDLLLDMYLNMRDFLVEILGLEVTKCGFLVANSGIYQFLLSFVFTALLLFELFRIFP
jgi:hypothetical protein